MAAMDTIIPVADAIPLEALKRVLVIKLRHHGDVLLTAPVFTALKRAAPQCEIDALVYADTMPMLAGHPALAQLHGIDRSWKKLGLVAQAEAEWHLLAQLRQRGYDLVIHLTEHPRGAWISRLCGARWSVAPKRAGRFWRGSFTHFHGHPANARRHMVERNLDALRRIGIQPAAADKRVSLVPGSDAEARVAVLMAQHGLTRKGFVLLHMTSRWLFKCWPGDKVAALAAALHARGLAVVLTAAAEPGELALIAQVRKEAQVPLVDLSGQLSLKELAALAGQARLFVGVDSAPMHIAAAMETPTVAIFGPSGELEWGPWDESGAGRHRVVASVDHPCRPCGIDGCGGGKVSECLTTLSVARVLAACEELLNR